MMNSFISLKKELNQFFFYQGKSHKEACKERDELYWTLLKANLHVITLVQFINLKYVHPMVSTVAKIEIIISEHMNNLEISVLA